MINFKNMWRVREFLKSKIFLQKVLIKKKIDFGSSKANSAFLKLLKNSKFYFEYGAGSSTFEAKRMRIRFISIESDKEIFKLIKNQLKSNNIKYYSLGPTSTYSYPIFLLNKKINDYINSVNEHLSRNTQLKMILIDGRFRVACCLNLLNFKEIIIKKKIVILLDDFIKRPHYKVLNNFFRIKLVGRMALLTPKKMINKEVFKKYISDPR